jgi:hypothetical protein
VGFFFSSLVWLCFFSLTTVSGSLTAKNLSLHAEYGDKSWRCSENCTALACADAWLVIVEPIMIPSSACGKGCWSMPHFLCRMMELESINQGLCVQLRILLGVMWERGKDEKIQQYSTVQYKEEKGTSKSYLNRYNLKNEQQ